MRTGTWKTRTVRLALLGALAFASARAFAGSPAPVSGFSVAPADDGWVMGWTTSPQQAEGVKVVVVARTDGRFPENPTDGEPVALRVDPPGTSISEPYAPPTSGETYSYSAFAVDESGTASAPAHAEATMPLQPPGTVQNLRRTDLGS